MLGLLCDALHGKISLDHCSKLVTKRQLFSVCTGRSSLKGVGGGVKGLLKVIQSVNYRTRT